MALGLVVVVSTISSLGLDAAFQVGLITVGFVDFTQHGASEEPVRSFLEEVSV